MNDWLLVVWRTIGSVGGREVWESRDLQRGEESTGVECAAGEVWL